MIDTPLSLQPEGMHNSNVLTINPYVYAQGNNALHYAVTYKNWKVVSVLLSTNGINVDIYNQVSISTYLVLYTGNPLFGNGSSIQVTFTLMKHIFHI